MKAKRIGEREGKVYCIKRVKSDRRTGGLRRRRSTGDWQMKNDAKVRGNRK